MDEIEEELNEYLLNERGFGANGASSNNKGKRKETGLAVKSIEYQGFTLLLGKNNKQNDYLIRKASNPEDIWLHAKDCPPGIL